MTDADLQAFLKGLPPRTRELVLALRRMVLRATPEAEESLLWGSLSYHRPQVGGRVKGAVCQIVVKGDKVRLDFIHGIRLADPCGLLQGDGLSKRFVPIGTVADAERPEVTALIRGAAALDPAWGSGIAFALRSGLLAGRAAARSIADPALAPVLAARYHDALAREAGSAAAALGSQYRHRQPAGRHRHGPGRLPAGKQQGEQRRGRGHYAHRPGRGLDCDRRHCPCDG